MNNSKMSKTLELLAEATDQINPLYVRGNEVQDIWEELPALGELYRHLEGMMGDN